VPGSARMAQIDGLEHRWMAEAQAGDAAAFGELIRPHQPAALRVATVVLGKSDGADDVVQQAIERAWKGVSTFRADGRFGPWFLKIVANCARNDRRSRGRRGRLQVRVAAAPPMTVVTPDEVAVADEERRRVVDAMNRLSRADRLVIALRHFEEMSEREMAETLDCRIGTVKSRLSRAMARLRTELDEAEADDA
jgi:RNA polymerase sigma-70 factor (ECF subfamily)